MPSASKKQLNYFLLVKAYQDGGPDALVNKWKILYPKRRLPTEEYLEKIINTSDRIDPADLEDLTSGVEGDKVLGDKHEYKVGYWMKFSSWYRSAQGERKQGVFIAKISKVRPDIKLIGFNSEQLHNKNGVKIAPLRRAKISDPNFMWLDFAYFNQVIETSKDKDSLMEKQIRKLVREAMNEMTINEFEGRLPQKEGDRVTTFANAFMDEIEDAQTNLTSLSNIEAEKFTDDDFRQHFVEVDVILEQFNRKIREISGLMSFSVNESKNTGGLQIKKRGQDGTVSVKTGMLVQKISDETSKGKIKHVGVDFDVFPNKNIIKVNWYSGDLRGSTQNVDPEDIEAQ